jgi:hypothetical protein
MSLIGFIAAGERTMMPFWLPPHQMFAVAHLMDLLQAQVWFWLQLMVVSGGTAWCIALASTLCFGGWYAATHPTTGNDRVMRRLARLLRYLTFGLTDYPLPDLESEERSSEAQRQPDTPARSPGRNSDHTGATASNKSRSGPLPTCYIKSCGILML